MQIDHVHFYAETAQHWRSWFVEKWGLQAVFPGALSSMSSSTAAVKAGTVRFQISEPSSIDCPVTQYLARHPAGVADLAFRVADIKAVLRQAAALKATILQPLYWRADPFDQARVRRAACIRGWGDLQHTLIEQDPLDLALGLTTGSTGPSLDWQDIDHVVLNVERGDLEQALSWYEQLFGFQRCQNFAIQTAHSALCSQVLRHPSGLQMPINEPASAGSQIQEFLDWNRGPGIQHMALRVGQILPLIARLRQNGIAFLPVPASYYSQLSQRPGFGLKPSEHQAIAEQEVLVDWRLGYPDALLLQAFTQPIFEQPTFFFELIERRICPVSQQLAAGFGEGNFQALFEAIEREQIKRGSLSG